MREANPPATPRKTQQQGKKNTKRETKDIDARGYIYIGIHRRVYAFLI